MAEICITRAIAKKVFFLWERSFPAVRRKHFLQERFTFGIGFASGEVLGAAKAIG